MPYDSCICRDCYPADAPRRDTSPLIPEAVQKAIIKGVIKKPILKARKPKGSRRT